MTTTKDDANSPGVAESTAAGLAEELLDWDPQEGGARAVYLTAGLMKRASVELVALVAALDAAVAGQARAREAEARLARQLDFCIADAEKLSNWLTGSTLARALLGELKSARAALAGGGGEQAEPAPEAPVPGAPDGKADADECDRRADGERYWRDLGASAVSDDVPDRAGRRSGGGDTQ